MLLFLFITNVFRNNIENIEIYARLTLKRIGVHNYP